MKRIDKTATHNREAIKAHRECPRKFEGVSALREFAG